MRASSGDSMDFTDALGVLRRYGRSIAAVFALVTLAALAGLMLQKPVYE